MDDCADEFGPNWPELGEDVDVSGPNMEAYDAKDDKLELWGKHGDFGSNSLKGPWDAKISELNFTRIQITVLYF